MFKSFLENSITHDLKVIRRLITKIPADSLDFRPKEGIRSTLELLQYLSYSGTGNLKYWYRTDESDFRTFFTVLVENAKKLNTLDDFAKAFDEQIAQVPALFAAISDEDLTNKIVDYPWGATAPLAEAIINSSLKYLTAYKTQLFLNLKLTSEEKLTTPDLWRKTEIEA